MQPDVIRHAVWAVALPALLVARVVAGLDGPVGGSAAWQGDTLYLTSGSGDQRGGWFAATSPMQDGPDSTPKGFRASFNLMMAPSAGASRVDLVLGEPPELPDEETSDDIGLLVRFAASGRGGDQAIGRIEVRYAGRSVATSASRRLRTGVPALVDIEITPAGELTVVHRNDSDPVLAILRRRITNWHIAPEWRPGIRGASGSPGASQWVGAIRLSQEPSECGNGLVEIGEDCERRVVQGCWDVWCSRRCTIDLPVRASPTELALRDGDACAPSLAAGDSPDLAIMGLCRLDGRSTHLIPAGDDLRLTIRDDSGRIAIEDVIPALPWDVQRREGWRMTSFERKGYFTRPSTSKTSAVEKLRMMFKRADTLKIAVKLDRTANQNVEAGRPVFVHLESNGLTADCRGSLYATVSDDSDDW